jgi:hypothetical protein
VTVRRAGGAEVADERQDLFGELVLELEIPRDLGDVDDEKQFGGQQRFRMLRRRTA